ncbi:MAG: Ig-like domain-containing protein, partial [Clostridiales bacterium]
VLGTSNPLKINYYPRNATKQIVTWSAEENQNILTINENTGEITALSKGQTRVSAYNEETKQTRECLITVVAPAGNIDLAANIKLTSQWIEENFKNFQVDYQSSWDWDVLAMKRAGQSISPYYMESLKNYLLNDSSINTNIAGLAKSGLVLAANKYDLTAFAGKDLVDLIYNSSSANMHKSGLNGPVYALLLADAGKLDLSGKAWDRDKLIAAVLEYQQGSAFSLLKGTDAKLDVDSSALALTALAPYYKQNGREVVTTAIDSAKTWLSKVQLSSAGFKSYFDEECSESPAQVIIALSSLGIDLKGNPSAWDTPFIKANTNLLQNLDMYSHRDGGVKHILSDAKGNSFSSQQALMAYVSYDRLINKQTAFYDFSDIKADDNSLLKALIAEYDKLSPNDYTSQSWAACQTAKTAIDSTLLANSDGRQQEIDAAYLSLDKAMKNLIKNHAQTSGDIAISGSADNWQIALTGLANITMDANFTGKLFTDMSAINDAALGLLVKDGSSVELTIPQGVKITSNNKNMEVLTPMILTDKYLADLKG